MPDIVVLGMLVADIVGTPIDELPARGTLSLLDKVELHPGGCGANTALALAKLGGASISLLGKAGTDAFGDFMVRAAQEVGLSAEGIQRESAVCTAATIVTIHSDAERSFLHVPGANALLGPEDVNWEATQGAKLFFVGGLQLLPRLEGQPLAHVFAEAKQRGMTTVLDTVMNPRSQGWDGLAPCLPFLDWAIPSFEEAAQLTGKQDEKEQVARLKHGGAKNAAIKLGSRGAYVAPETGNPFYVEPLLVEAVDALGAGDAWAAGFLLGLFQDWPLERTTQFANAVGACCVQSLGATSGIRPLTETLAMLKDL